MKIAVMLTVSTLLFAGGLFLGVRGPAAQSETTIPCPRAVDAPFGGFDGWSEIEVQANFARALVARNGLLTCQYGFGRNPEPFFGIQRPCPTGHRCVAQGQGFRVRP